MKEWFYVCSVDRDNPNSTYRFLVKPYDYTNPMWSERPEGCNLYEKEEAEKVIYTLQAFDKGRWHSYYGYIAYADAWKKVNGGLR